MEFIPLYYKDKLEIINPEGYTGMVTLWTPVKDIVVKGRQMDGLEKKLRGTNPELFAPNSPLVALSNLYGNGLPQMLANLAYNPQVERIAVTGGDSQKSGEALERFFSAGVENVEIGGVKMSRIKGTDYVVDSQLLPSSFKRTPEIRRFSTSDLPSLVTYLKEPQKYTANEDERLKIELAVPKFKDFPSDTTSHNINAKTPLEAWMEVMYLIDRFGINVELEKGKRRALFNLDVNISNPAFEAEETLKKFNFDPEKLRAYRNDILDPDQHDQPYTYGHRLRSYWGGDSLTQIAKLLKNDPMNRHGLTCLWDTSKDLIQKESSAPCFTDAYFVNMDNKLMMSTSFRTHNAVSAWLFNLYGLRAIQEKVAAESELIPGQINVRSRYIGIDPDNAKTISSLELISKNREKNINVNDPRGYFVIEAREGEIYATHYHPMKTPLKEYRGKSAIEIKDQLRQDSVISDSDHAMWVGHELARAEFELKGKIAEL